jgi:hypothetical protein
MVTSFLLVLGLLRTQGEFHAQTSRGTDPLRVRVEIARGPHFVGQAFELEVGVIAGASRPKIDPPRIAGARTWLIGTDLRPIATSGIGAVVAQRNLFLSRFRVVTSRPGTLEIPPISAEVDGRTGRSLTKRIEIQPVPLEDRPREFLGGVGQFTVNAEADPSVIRFGQELKYRITVTGPGAWGSSGRPDLARALKSAAGLRVVAEPDDATDEPASRTFVYRLRPARAGAIILPPVSVAAFDPAIKRYVTKATSSVTVRVVSTPAFNPSAIEGLRSPANPLLFSWVEWTAWSVSAVLLIGASTALLRVRGRRRSGPRHGPAAARAFAARLARKLTPATRPPGHGSASGTDPTSHFGGCDQRCWEAAHKISDNLTRYLELGSGRPRGALTPIEARQGVAGLTGSDDLAACAERLAAQCDRALYGEPNGELHAVSLLESARQLFHALGLVKISRRPGVAQPERE